MLLKDIASRTLGGAGESPRGGGVAAAAGAAGGAGSPPGGAAAPAAASSTGKSLLEALLESDPTTGFAAVTTAVEGMCWHDDAAFRFALLARTLVGMAPRDPRLYAYVGGEVLRAAISCLASEVG